MRLVSIKTNLRVTVLCVLIFLIITFFFLKFQSNCGKLASKHVSSSELNNASPTKRQRIKAAPTVGQDYQAADLTSTTQRSGLLNGREICVLSGNEKMSKQNLEKGIHELGGTVVQHRGNWVGATLTAICATSAILKSFYFPGPETFCVVAGKKDFRFKNLVDKGEIDVVTVDWFVHVLSGEKLLDWEPRDLLAMSSKTRADMELKYDNFQDSFHNPTNIDALKCSLEKVSEQVSCLFSCVYYIFDLMKVKIEFSLYLILKLNLIRALQ